MPIPTLNQNELIQSQLVPFAGCNSLLFDTSRSNDRSVTHLPTSGSHWLLRLRRRRQIQRPSFAQRRCAEDFRSNPHLVARLLRLHPHYQSRLPGDGGAV